MRAKSVRWLVAFLVFLTATSHLGCANNPLDDILVWDPFERDDPADLAKYGPTPAQRIEELRALAAEAKAMGPQRQDQVSYELAEELTDSENPLVRIELARTLGALKTQIADDALRSATKDDDANVRVALCETFSRRGDVRMLAEILASDGDDQVRLAAARGLGSIADPDAETQRFIRQSLSVALEDPNPALQHRAVLALKDATGQDFGGDMEAWRRFARGGQTPTPDTPSLAERINEIF
jgi:HEAT repeat protein